MPTLRDLARMFNIDPDAAEVAATLGSGAVAAPVAGWAGMLSAAGNGGDVERMARVVERVQKAFSYEPRGAGAQRAMGAVGEALEPLEQGKRWLGDTALEATGSPGAAAAAYSAPDVLLGMFPFLKGAKAAGARSGAAGGAIPGSAEAQLGSLDPALAMQIIRRTMKEGGSTTDVATGNVAPRRGWAVAEVPPNVSGKPTPQNIIPASELTPKSLNNMIDTTPALRDASAIGTWLDNGNVYVDPSEVIRAPFKARLETTRRGQLASWDMARRPGARGGRPDTPWKPEAPPWTKQSGAVRIARGGDEIRDSLRAAGFAGADAGYQVGKGAAAEREVMREMLRRPPEPYAPPSGVLLDYSSWADDIRPDLSAFSTIGQLGRLPRAQPVRSIGKAQGILGDYELQDLMMLAAQRGEGMGGKLWYNTSPLYQALRSAGGTDRDFAALVAQNYGSSARTSLLPNIAHASLINHALKSGLIDPTMDLASAQRALSAYHAGRSGTGKGLQMMPSHLKGAFDFEQTGRLAQGYDTSQKFSGYGHGLAGFRKPVALDTHELNFIARALPPSRRADYFGPKGDIKMFETNEYPVIESLYQDRLAPLTGMEPADFQASRWLGGGEVTGLRSPPVPFADAYERLVAWNAKERGVNPQQLLRDVLLGRDYLYPYRAHGGSGLPPAEVILR